MATPTFLAGFCTVLASILAYGTTQTHLLYNSGLPPACAEASCSSASPHPANGGTLGRGKHAGRGIDGNHGTRTGQPQWSPEHPVTGEGSRATRSPGAPARQGAAARRHPGGSAQRPRVMVVYRTQQRSSGQFLGAVTITNLGKTVLSGWQLGMQYRRATISQVWNARWIPASPRDRHAGLVAALTSQRPLRPGRSVRFVFLARGAAGPPGGCAFDGYRCTFRSHGPRQPHAIGQDSGQGHARNPGPGHRHQPGTARGHNPRSARAHTTGSAAVQLTGSVRADATGSGRAQATGRAHPASGLHAQGQQRARGQPHAKGHRHARHRHHHRDRKGARYRLV